MDKTFLIFFSMVLAVLVKRRASTALYASCTVLEQTRQAGLYATPARQQHTDTGLRNSFVSTNASSRRLLIGSSMSTSFRATTTLSSRRGGQSPTHTTIIFSLHFRAPSDVGNWDRSVVQDILKEIAQTQQIDLNAKKRFKGTSQCIAYFPSSDSRHNNSRGD